MADMIIKPSSGNDLVIQGGDNSPAITVGNTGATTFTEATTLSGGVAGNTTFTGNTTLSGSANNLGTVTAGTYKGTIHSDATFPAGHVINTVTTHSNTEVYAGSTSWVTITGMAGTITPTYSNSKILIGFYCGSMVQQTPNSLMVKVTGTTTGTVTEKTLYPGYSDHATSQWFPAPIGFICFDSPGTTNAQTYQLYCKNQSGSITSRWRINSYETAGPIQNGTVIIQEIKV